MNFSSMYSGSLPGRIHVTIISSRKKKLLCLSRTSFSLILTNFCWSPLSNEAIYVN